MSRLRGSELDDYYRKMDTDSLRREFNELVAEFNSKGDCEICYPLTSIWYCAKARGITLPDATQASPQNPCW